MATYLKRTSKMFDLSLSRPSADVHLRDLMCPICCGILIEPVTLPCTHNLCLRCLKGTFEHNSLSCPLCRLRVGSWLRTATKSETLVNHGLWEFIRNKFPKEVEDKYNGEERDIGLVDSDFAANRILSVAGEIHREYEAQLQMAEEEMRRQRQAEQMASEVLIQKIQAEEQQQLLVQLAQDQLLAKTLAKKQVMEKQKETSKCYNESLNTSVSNYSFNIKSTHVNNVEAPQTETAQLESKKMSLPKSIRDNLELRRTNMTLLSKIRAERYCKIKANTLNTHKNCSPKQLAVYNAVTKTLKHQPSWKHQMFQSCSSDYSMEPGCSTSKSYITETKEELRIPSDVVNSKKKSLGVEVCTTHVSHRTDDDDRIGSAESSGSHDSINQEIHHFKPIKTVPRTSLKISSDGKQIDPKLIRVVPIVKRVTNAVLKPPSPTYLKHIIGCSWSAFRGRARQNIKEKIAAYSLDMGTSIEQKPSTSLNYSQIASSKSTKPQTDDTRLDFIDEPSFDSNKNYTKHANKIINGTKASKKLSLNDESSVRKTRKFWKTRLRNGMIAKSKSYENTCNDEKKIELILDRKEEKNNMRNSIRSPICKTYLHNDEPDDGNDIAVENIAERIKRRKINIEKKREPETECDVISERSMKRNVRKKVLSERRDESTATDLVLLSQKSAKVGKKISSRIKRQKVHRTSQSSTIESPRKSETSSTYAASSKVIAKRSSRNPTSTIFLKKDDESNDACNNDSKFVDSSLSRIFNKAEEHFSKETVPNARVRHNFSDEEVIKEQQRIEQLLLQERQDFELARHLQAKFDEMERIAGRTRRSRRAIEGSINIDLVDLREIGATKTIRKMSEASRSAKRPIVLRNVNIMPKKKRGRPLKRVKQDEMRAR